MQALLLTLSIALQPWYNRKRRHSSLNYQRPYEKEMKYLMPNNGLIFSDGVETDFLKFNSGSIATIGIADEKANLVLS